MWATKTAQRTSAGSVRSTRRSPWVWHMICHWNAYAELLPPSADHHYVFSQRDTDWTTHLHTHTHTHMHIDARVGGQLWCQRKHTHTHTHIWRNACCVVRWSAARKRGRRRKTEKAQWHTEDVWQQGFLLTIMAEALRVLSLSWCLNSMTHHLCKWNNVYAPDVKSKWTSG